jgi:hypothetical protein
MLQETNVSEQQLRTKMPSLKSLFSDLIKPTSVGPIV